VKIPKFSKALRTYLFLDLGFKKFKKKGLSDLKGDPK
jgi:hypothetical protein